MPLRAIVFDFDGVLANSEPLHLRAFQEVLADRGVVLTRDTYYERYLGYDDVGVFRVIGEERGAPFTGSQIAALVAAKAQRLEMLERSVSVLFPGAADTVRRMAAIVPLAIASGALDAEIRRVLDREELTRYFVAIVAAEHTPVSKPAPDPYVCAVARLASVLHVDLLPAECVAVEDSVWGLASARAAGLRTVAVAQTYDAAALAAADLIVASIGELTSDLLQTLAFD